MKIDNSFIAVYNVTSKSENVKIFRYISGFYLHFHLIELSDFEAFINGNKIELIFCDNNQYFCYKFQNIGLFEIKISIKKALSNLRYFFHYCDKLVYVNFSEAFDTSNVLNAASMFEGCTSLQAVNISSFNTSLISSLTYMFYECYELTSIDLSNFDTRNIMYFEGMFRYNYKLNYIDISSFNTTKFGKVSLFEYMPKKGTIIINNKTFDGIIPSGWNVIYKDY